MDLFPIFLNITKKPCLVVGGGPVALRRAASLSRSGARVIVVAPQILPGFGRLRGVVLHRRPFRPSDLGSGQRKVFLVVAATDRSDVNDSVSRFCTGRGILVNRVDDPGRGNFHVPAVFRRGRIALALSTGGASPALAKMMVRRAGEALGPAVNRTATQLARGRKKLLALPLPKRRKAIRKIFHKAGLVNIDK